MSKTINLPLTLDQLAFTLKQLPREDIEELDLMLDDKLKTTVLNRGKTAEQEMKRGDTLSFQEIKEEFNV